MKGYARTPSYELVEVTRADVLTLFADHHAYRSAGRVCTYAYAVLERGAPVAAFLWQPPPPQAAKAVCAACPQGVLSLSRMVAVPHDKREIRHISRPLRRQMRKLIDRTRWPVLVTYSDESVDHTGYVYKCSGWQPTERHKARTFTIDGARVSRYANGAAGVPEGATPGWAWIQRWEHNVCDDPAALFAAHWRSELVPGKVWRSGSPARTYVRIEQQEPALAAG